MYKNIEESTPIKLPELKEGLSKLNIKVKADIFVTKILENGGIVNAVEAISVMEEFVKLVRKDERFIDYIRIELDKERGKITTTSGAKIQRCEVGVIYDYSADEQWRIINEQAQEISIMLKTREAYLRGLKEGEVVVDKTTGEITAIGPLKSSTSSYRITLKK